MAYLLFWKLYNLQVKYKFNTLYITAHSMGGLVARSLIMDYGRLINVDLFRLASIPPAWWRLRSSRIGTTCRFPSEAMKPAC